MVICINSYHARNPEFVVATSHPQHHCQQHLTLSEGKRFHALQVSIVRLITASARDPFQNRFIQYLNTVITHHIGTSYKSRKYFQTSWKKTSSPTSFTSFWRNTQCIYDNHPVLHPVHNSAMVKSLTYKRFNRINNIDNRSWKISRQQ